MNSESSINEASTRSNEFIVEQEKRITSMEWQLRLSEADNAELRRQLDRCTIHADSLMAQINRLSVIDEPSIRGPVETTCNLPKEHC